LSIVAIGSLEENTVTVATKNYSGSWRHSAETTTNRRQSKVIGGRFYDHDHGSVFRRVSVEAHPINPVALSWNSLQRPPRANLLFRFGAAESVDGQIAAGKWTASTVRKNSRQAYEKIPAGARRADARGRKGECHAGSFATTFTACTAQFAGGR
jgi:hypothetical protein